MRTLKELLAEAETPTKRGMSARTGGPSAADAFSGGGGTGESPRFGTAVTAPQQQQQHVPKELQPAAEAVAAAGEATAASNALVERCSAMLQRVRS